MKSLSYILTASLALNGCSHLAASLSEQPLTYHSNFKSHMLVVEVPKPWYVPNIVVRNKILNAVKDYQNIDGLQLKAFTLNETGVFGGVYFWKDRASLDLYYDKTRIEQVAKRRGAMPILKYYGVESSATRKEGLKQFNQKEQSWNGNFYLIMEPTLEPDIASQILAREPKTLIAVFIVSSREDNKSYQVTLWESKDAIPKIRLKRALNHYEVPAILQGEKSNQNQ